MALPFAPLQESWYVLSELIAGVVSEPLSAFAPLHPLDAVHDVTFVEVHVNVVDPPGVTPGGDALS